jgi:hypothetical protein
VALFKERSVNGKLLLFQYAEWHAICIMSWGLFKDDVYQLPTTFRGGAHLQISFSLAV